MKIFREENEPSRVNNEGSDVSDRDLVLSACSGDRQAYGRLIMRFQKKVFRMVYLMVGRFDTAEDIVQEAFVKAYQSLARFEKDRPFYPWIAAIARNLAVNQIKRELREMPVGEDDDFLLEKATPSMNPLEELLEKENEKRFLAAVKGLPAPFRAVFILRSFEKLSYEEIAKELGITVGTVDSRLNRARQKLTEALKDLL